jgi:CBS-domain-containing membrane protein
MFDLRQYVIMKIHTYMKQNVISVPVTATVMEATDLFVQHHIGTLPVVDAEQKLVGILHLSDLLELVMPVFVNLVHDFDFVTEDFGDYEDLRPSPETAVQSVKTLMEPPFSVSANAGLLLAFATMKKHNTYDLPVVNEHGQLVGLASRVDIGTALIGRWHEDINEEIRD